MYVKMQGGELRLWRTKVPDRKYTKDRLPFEQPKVNLYHWIAVTFNLACKLSSRLFTDSATEINTCSVLVT